METSLHRELKRLYAGPAARMEVRLGRFRVDAILEDAAGEQLVEIQHGPLWAIRDKIRQLIRRRRVRVVKPIVRRKLLVKCQSRGGRVIDRRYSPRQGRLLELFDELVYFIRAFPHRNLIVEAILVDIEEWRYPSPVRRRRGRRQFQIQDQTIISIHQVLPLASAAQLRHLVPCELPPLFHTAHLAAELQIERFVAQRIAYVLRKTGAVQTVGKDRGAWIYQWVDEVPLPKAG